LRRQGRVSANPFELVERSDKPVFLKGASGEEFFIRAGASSPALPASHTHDYIQQRFK
jgi:hypothetical protein